MKTPDPAFLPIIGVIIVSFNAADIIAECLESLFASRGVRLRVVVVDNASPDQSCSVVRDWASGAVPFAMSAASPVSPGPVPKPVRLEEREDPSDAPLTAPLTLLQTGLNGGYAYAINRAIALLQDDPEIELFWVLNPDCVVPPDTARAFADAGRDGQFALMGGRVRDYALPALLQSDNGRVERWSGRCQSINAGARADEVTPPDAATVDFISGANVVASRAFIDRVGLMPEHYFLYFEEVDWAFQRGDMPLRIAPGADVYHHGGTAIGSGTITRAASPFSTWFNFRGRTLFVDRHLPQAWAGVRALGAAKAAQLLLRGQPAAAWAAFSGTFKLGPPRIVRERITDPRARALAFGEKAR